MFFGSSFRLDLLLINVAIVLEFAKEAFAELNDTAVSNIEDTLVLQEKGTRLDQLCSLNFIYFMFDINRFSVIKCSEVISSDKFFLDKYNLEVALISILLTTISSFAISFSRVSLVSQQVHITNQHSIRLRMAGHPYAVAALNCLKTACFRKGGEQDDQA